MRLYSKKIPAWEASRQFVNGAMRDISAFDRITRISDDIEKSRYYNAEWGRASERVVGQLKQKVKELKELLFFKGAVYEITFNLKGKFSNTQLALLYDLPSREDLCGWKNIKVLTAPAGCKSIEYHTHTKMGIFGC